MNGDNNRIDAAIKGFIDRRFEIIKILGNGGEGTVYKCKSINWGINDQKQFALKCQRFCKDDEIEFIDNIIVYQNQYENEICQGQLNYQSSGLIRIYERFQSNNSNFILMELGELDLYHYLQQQQNLTIESKIKIMIQVNILTYSQITQAISYLHSKNLIHRDIKPENFIKVSDQFKLIDFGLTKQNSNIFKTAKVGTLLFQAPELLECKTDYDFSIDIWSLGCVFYEILLGQALFNGIYQIYLGQNQLQVTQMILQSKVNSNFLNERLNIGQIDDTLKDLLMQMFKYNPSERITLDKVMSILIQFSSNKKKNQQQQQFPKFPIQPETKVFTQQNFPNIGNTINLQISQLQEQFKDFNNQQAEKSKTIENLLQQLLNQNDQLQYRIQNLEQKIDDCTSQIRKKESQDQDQNISYQQQIQKYETQLRIKTNQEQENSIEIQDYQKKIQNLESILLEEKRKHDSAINDYQDKVNQLETKLQEYNIQDTQKQQIMDQQTQKKEIQQNQEQQKINSKNENYIQQTLNQEESTLNEKNQNNENRLILDGEKNEYQQQNNQHVINKSFEEIKSYIEDILKLLYSATTKQQNKKNCKSQSNKPILDEKQQVQDKLLKTLQQIVTAYNKGQTQLNELRSLIFDSTKLDFGKINNIITQFYSEIQPQILINQEKKEIQKQEIQKQEIQKQEIEPIEKKLEVEKKQIQNKSKKQDKKQDKK